MTTRRIIDLSTPLYDGIRGLTTEPCTSIEADGYNTTTLHLYTHTGTHMDAPKHFVPGGGAIDGIALNACVGPAQVIDVTSVQPDGMIEVETNHGGLKVRASDVGIDDVALDAGGLERKLRVFRLPEQNTCREFRGEVSVPLKAKGDNQLWVCVTTEDGFQAWSSPMFVFRDA